MLRRSLLLALAIPFLALGAAAQDSRTARLHRDFMAKKRQVLLEAGQRHLELGIWCRDKGLIPQATSEFIDAVEVSEKRHPGASQVLGIMRSLGDDFWRRRRKSPSKSLLAQYAKRRTKAVKTEAKERFALARWAHRKGLPEGAAEFEFLVERRNEPLEFNGKDQVVLPEGAVPSDVSRSIRDNAIEINGALWMRDEFLSKLPDGRRDLPGRERAPARAEPNWAGPAGRSARVLHRVASDPHEGHRRLPQDKMTLFLFKDAETYGAYLDASGRGKAKAAAGLAMSRQNTALVNGEGRSDDDIRAVALHELSHLFMYGVTRSRMPSWYSEGFAETYGGQGCFQWDGEALESRGVMADHRIEALAAGDVYIPLAELLTADALELLGSDRERALVFYAESWAFVRYLRTEAPKDVREAFATWEFVCRGKALGAVIGRPTEAGDRAPAMQLFDDTFGGDLKRIEAGFQEYLSTL